MTPRSGDPAMPTTLWSRLFWTSSRPLSRPRIFSEQRRRHWSCSLRQIAKWLDRPAEVIPARWQSVRISVSQLHHARVGVTAQDRWQNHKANIRAALRWFGKEHDVPQRGARLSAEWATLRDRIDSRLRDRIYSLMRYCSARGVLPSAVDDEIFADYWRYRTETTALATTTPQSALWCGPGMPVLMQSMAARCSGSPSHLSRRPSLPGRNFLTACAGRSTTIWPVSLSPTARLDGKRIQPCSPGTIRYRLAELVAMARMAVRLGVPIESLTSLGRAPTARCRRTGDRRVLEKKWR